ncbi:hypothetical protein J4Q44_G00221520 [Coregonus suidteri]|uniref:Secreted protein n=1 Tax=Coregonus suidteri TaxID=861788 RepID=A0AAN8LD53_9TELE
MGFELVLKTLPLHCLTHLLLSAIRCEPADHPALEHLRSVLLSQVVRQPDPGTTLVWTACQNRSRTCGCGCAHRSSTNWTVRRCSRHGARGG